MERLRGWIEGAFDESEIKEDDFGYTITGTIKFDNNRKKLFLSVAGDTLEKAFGLLLKESCMALKAFAQDAEDWRFVEELRKGGRR